MNTESISPITTHVHPFLQVMSPTERVVGAARIATPAVVVDGQTKTVDHQLEEKWAVPAAAALNKMLVMLGNLSE